MSYMHGKARRTVGLSSRALNLEDSMVVHVGKASPGGREASRPSETSGFLDSRRVLRESRLRPWLADQKMGSPHASIDNGTAASRLQGIRNRVQARKDAAPQARTQGIRQSARTQVTTKVAPEKASTSQARTQGIRQLARSQAPTKATPATASRLRLGESKTMECLLEKERALDRVRQVKEGVFASRFRAGTVAKTRLPEHARAVPEALPVRSAKLPSSGSSTLSSGGQLDTKTRRGAGVPALSSAAMPKSKTGSGPVDDSSLPAGVFEKIRREGSDGPAFIFKKVSWRFMNKWENVFSPPEGRVVFSTEPEEAETNTSHVPLWITPAPRYSELGKTPVRPDCSRPRRRPMAPPLPESPPNQSVYWPDRSEMRLTSAGSVAKVVASEKMSGSSSGSRSLQLRHRLCSVDHRVPAHRLCYPARSALRIGPRKSKAIVRFDDNTSVKVVSRWVTDLYSDYRYSCGAISGWSADPDWNPDPEHPSDNAHIRIWSSHPEDCNHHSGHRVGYPGFGNGDPFWGNVACCAPHLRELQWPDPCPVQLYRLPWVPELGLQGDCTCEASGPFDCPRKLYRKRLDFAYVDLTCRGPKTGKLVALRLVLARMNWARGVAVIPS